VVNPAIEAALKHRNYPEVTRLISSLSPADPWRQFYQAQLHEAQVEWELAEAIYRDILRQGSLPKLALEARQGLQRLAQHHQAEQQEQVAQRQAQVAANTALPGQTDPGVLILEPVPPDAKSEMVPAFARIMQIDPYSARLLIPSRGWRLYRTGSVGELQVYGQDLRDAGIPVFWQALSAIKAIKVQQVCYFETLKDPVRVMVKAAHSHEPPQPFTFKWSDVWQTVTGQLPIFENVVDLDARGVLQRKEKTQDYAQFCDLHLPSGILRFYDVAYQFNQGIPLAVESTAGTSWANWQGLTALWQRSLSGRPCWSDFSAFAETVIDHPDTLERIDPHINLFRRADSHWDQTFHLYSSLAYLRTTQGHRG
jgi:hypothetical protein